MKKIIFAIIFIPSTLFAEQTVINSYNDAKNNYFYTKLYVNNTGVSLYCGIQRPIKIGGGRSIEHVMPASWIAQHFGCSNRDCNKIHYKYAEADLHNLWIAVRNINSSRSNFIFGEIKGENRFDYCPAFERTYNSKFNIVEPRDSVKGDIARSLLYMNAEYGVTLKGMLLMLKEWSRLDPPDEHENWRNERINQLQGTRNKFIDDYIYIK